MKNSTPLLLVGGFGFVGRNILDAMENDEAFSGLSPVIIDDLSNAAPGYEALQLPAHIGSYQEQAAIDFANAQGAGETGNASANGRVIVFLAGETRVAESKDRPMDFIEANITAPSQFVLDAVKSGDHFVLISTAGALFDGTFEVSVDSAYCPKNFYGATKAAEEMILEKLVELRGGSFSVVRMTNVYGKFSDNKKSAIHAFTRAALAGDTVTINGDGKQSRDFIYAGDVGRGIATLAARLRAAEDTQKLNMLGSGVSISLMDVVAAIEAAAQAPLAYEKTPAKELLATEPRDVMASAKDVRELLGEQITAFEEGIRQTYDYYKN
ncbi:NAD-dependent epimerase/dehydratase family protein [Lentibacter algarum]|uniref:NAD-dependent epimerase/dehydratase family protein n=1 Tax=Lentibacter algarum TaxID=576131 RepID=UPI001C075277|nr:NAD-dependent epimerase/dehydratase family protein [Lentibacter algarum]MBU2980665.1 NAD-dependent epimerase/dehydratase family protein [Lentibacter algarum]